MEPQAIVIVYNGKAPQPAVIEELARVIVTEKVTVPELLEIKHFDGDSLAKAIVTKATIDFTKNDQKGNEEVIKNTLTLLSDMFNHEIRIANVGNYGLVELHMSIDREYLNFDKRSPEQHEAFRNAMEIIGKNIICRKHYKSFGWSDDVYHVFRTLAKINSSDV